MMASSWILVKTAVAVVTTALTASSIHNMAQAVMIVNNSCNNKNLKSHTIKSDILQGLPRHKTHVLVENLQQMKRRDLLELFCQSSSPSSTRIQGDYDGCLLDNNGLTLVTQFLTDGLFGKGKRWSGKAFTSSNRGINRFYSSQEENPIQQHSFSYNIGQSRLHPNKNSIRLDYSHDQAPWSLWKTMTDELRLVAVLNDGGEVWIGMGCMAWSGGVWNSSPFCLYRQKDTTGIESGNRQ